MDNITLAEFAAEASKNKYETQVLEIKSAKKDCPKNLFGTLSSFSNQDGGGVILFGLDEENDFSVTGVYDAHDLQKRISEQCAQMHPICRPFFTVAKINGKTVVSAEIPPVDYADRPCYYKGKGMTKGSYVRVGDNDLLMTGYEVYRYEAYRRQNRDDLKIIENTSVNSYNAQNIKKFAELVKTERLNLSAFSDEQIYELTGIIVNGKTSLSGWILFNDYPQSIFPQFSVTAVVLPGTEMGETGLNGARFIDNRRFDGNLQCMLNETEKFIVRNMKNNVIINDDGKRADKTEYPVRAVREILLNALTHRDYGVYSESVPVTVEMYRDRIEITSPGGLYGRTGLDDLGKVKTEIRNASLVNILEIMRVVENRHSGIPTIRKEMEAYDLPAPIFEDTRGFFKVTLYNKYTDLLKYCKKPRLRSEIAAFCNVTPEYAMSNKILPLIKNGNLKMTIPEKPKSKLQRYYSPK